MARFQRAFTRVGDLRRARAIEPQEAAIRQGEGGANPIYEFRAFQAVRIEEVAEQEKARLGT